MQPAAIDLRSPVASASQQVQHLRQILLWPLRLVALRRGDDVQRRPWELLGADAATSPWRRVIDEYTGSADRFHERHYHEFVTFLPYVQQFLYGEGRGRYGDTWPSSMHVFRRDDVRAVRVQPRVGSTAYTLEVVHVDLYFFDDVDIVLLNVEVAGDNLDLRETQEILYRFGRGYPSGWDAAGQPLHTMAGVDWLDAEGRVLASSDAQERESYLEFVGE